MKLHINRKVLSILACAAGVAAVLLAVAGFSDSLVGDPSSVGSAADGETITVKGPTQLSVYEDGGVYLGEEYFVPKKHVETVLFMGIDQMRETMEDTTYNEQADFIMLMVIDRDAEQFTMLHLNRDTMCDVMRLSDMNEKLGRYRVQLAVAHVFGNNERARCRNVVDAVENLLYGIEIDHYISLTMDAIPILNDEIGGVTLTLSEDLTKLDPSFENGATVTLKGSKALSYVRARMSVGDGSNLGRMNRQRQYLTALFDKYRERGGGDFTKSLLKVNDYMDSDCTIEQLQRIADMVMQYEFLGIDTTEGEAVIGEQYMEYIIDEPQLQKQVINLFYTKKETP